MVRIQIPSYIITIFLIRVPFFSLFFTCQDNLVSKYKKTVHNLVPTKIKETKLNTVPKQILNTARNLVGM